MSSDASESAVREAIAAGVADFLVKPIRRNEVVTLWQHVWRSMHAPLSAGAGAGHRWLASDSRARSPQGAQLCDCTQDEGRLAALAAAH